MVSRFLHHGGRFTSPLRVLNHMLNTLSQAEIPLVSNKASKMVAVQNQNKRRNKEENCTKEAAKISSKRLKSYIVQNINCSEKHLGHTA